MYLNEYGFSEITREQFRQLGMLTLKRYEFQIRHNDIPFAWIRFSAFSKKTYFFWYNITMSWDNERNESFESWASKFNSRAKEFLEYLGPNAYQAWKDFNIEGPG